MYIRSYDYHALRISELSELSVLDGCEWVWSVVEGVGGCKGLTRRSPLLGEVGG